MTTPTPLAVHLYCMRLIRAHEDAEPGKPIGVYFAQAQRYILGRIRHELDNRNAGLDWQTSHWQVALRHLKAGCPAPKLDPGPTVLPAMCGGLTIHA